MLWAEKQSDYVHNFYKAQMNTYWFNPSLIYDMWSDAIDDPFKDSWWMLATTTTSENEKYTAYGFKSISFTHVLLSKLFLLPILFALFLVALCISFTFKCAFSKSWVADKIFLFFKYFCFFNLPIRYVIEMY